MEKQYYRTGELPQVGDTIELVSEERFRLTEYQCPGIISNRATVHIIVNFNGRRIIGIGEEIIYYDEDENGNIWDPFYFKLISRKS